MFKIDAGEQGTLMVPIIFPNLVVHADINKFVGTLLRRQFDKPVEAISAGFCEIECDAVHGKSESMGNLASDPIDAKIIDTYNYTHGIGFGR